MKGGKATSSPETPSLVMGGGGQKLPIAKLRLILEGLHKIKVTFTLKKQIQN